MKPAAMAQATCIELPTEVMTLSASAMQPLQTLLSRFGLQLVLVADTDIISGSYWGECEAGLIGDFLYARPDTPLHSVLHEASHYVCMDAQRRAALHRDAGGDYTEENAVCYLQILLSDQVSGFGQARMFTDMDAWGYTFRLGSARAWFEQEAQDAQQWLLNAGLIDESMQPTWQVRA